MTLFSVMMYLRVISFKIPVKESRLAAIFETLTESSFRDLRPTSMNLLERRNKEILQTACQIQF